MDGIKIHIPTRSGDVFSGAEYDLYTDADTPILKVYQSGGGTIPFLENQATPYTFPISHDLGYIPHWAVFSELVAGSNEFRLASSSQLTLAGDKVFVITGMTESELIIQWIPQVANPIGDYQFYFHIYWDEL